VDFAQALGAGTRKNDKKKTKKKEGKRVVPADLVRALKKKNTAPGVLGKKDGKNRVPSPPGGTST